MKKLFIMIAAALAALMLAACDGSEIVTETAEVTTVSDVATARLPMPENQTLCREDEPE